MGFLSSFNSLLKSWGGKRKREEDETVTTENKRVRVNSYTLTPVHGRKEAVDIRRHNHYYDYNEIVKSTETRTIEFKQGGLIFDTNKLTQLVGRYGSAFLNSEGGVLLAGVTDDGYVKGLSVGDKDEARIRHGIRNEIESFRPIVTYNLWSVEFVPVKGTGNPRLRISERVVVEISFKKGNIENIYEDSSHQVFLRRDGGVQGPLRPLDLKNLVISRYNETLKMRKQKMSVEQGTLPMSSLATPAAIPKKTVTVVDEQEERRAQLEKKGIKFVKF